MLQSEDILFQLFSVTVALLLFFISGATFKMLGSIFPTQATFKDISQSTVGIVSSATAISNLIASILLPIIATPQNQKFYLISGGLVSAVCSLCFALPVYGPNGVVFAVMCAICRMTCWAGGAFIWGTSIPVLVSGFPRLEERFLCLILLSYSFGVLLGPACGSLFYNGWLYYPGFPDQADHSLTIVWRHTNHTKFRVWFCHDQLSNHLWSKLGSAWNHTPVWPRLWSAWSLEWSKLWLTCYHRWTRLLSACSHEWPRL